MRWPQFGLTFVSFTTGTWSTTTGVCGPLNWSCFSLLSPVAHGCRNYFRLLYSHFVLPQCSRLMSASCCLSPTNLVSALGRQMSVVGLQRWAGGLLFLGCPDGNEHAIRDTLHYRFQTIGYLNMYNISQNCVKAGPDV